MGDGVRGAKLSSHHSSLKLNYTEAWHLKIDWGSFSLDVSSNNTCDHVGMKLIIGCDGQCSLSTWPGSRITQETNLQTPKRVSLTSEHAFERPPYQDLLRCEDPSTVRASIPRIRMVKQEKACWTQVLVAVCFLPMNGMWSAASDSCCCHVLPTMACPLKLRATQKTCFWSHF